ncbi:hypothetical protein [Pseudopedobacter sp.]|uniref:hypothetical protein n=1 Tax=Pseudopedobacter sp. TaxID=1936787 RepID=UPI003342DB3F
MSIDNKYQQVISELEKLLGDYKSAESKELLWKFFALTVSGGFSSQPVEKREDLLTFYEYLKRLLDVLELLEVELKNNRRGVSMKTLLKPSL